MLAIRAFSGHFSSRYPAVYYKNRNTTPRCVTEEGNGNVPVGSLGPAFCVTFCEHTPHACASDVLH
jgi:hypothetical protein